MNKLVGPRRVSISLDNIEVENCYLLNLVFITIFTTIIRVPPYSDTMSKTYEKAFAPNLFRCIDQIKDEKVMRYSPWRLGFNINLTF